MWILSALVSAAFNGGLIIYDKYLLNTHALPPLALGAFRGLIAALLILPLVFIFDETGALSNQTFWLATLANTALVTSSTLLLFKVLSKHDASLISGMFSIEPLFVIVTAFFLLGETVTPHGLIGMLIIIAGSALLQKSRIKGDWETKFYHSPWAGLILFMVLASAATAFSKMALMNGGIFIYLSLRYAMQSAVFLALLAVAKAGKPFSDYTFNIRHLGSGAILSVVVILEMIAVKAAPVAYVQTVLSLCMFFTLIIEGLITKKIWNKTRLLACCIMFAGITVLALWT